MRPGVQDHASPRSRKCSLAEHPTTPQDTESSSPTTFFLVREQDMTASAATMASSASSNTHAGIADSSYGVHSLEETLADIADTSAIVDDDIRHDGDDVEDEETQASRRRSTLRAIDFLENRIHQNRLASVSPVDFHRRGSLHSPAPSASRPTTPSMSNLPSDDASSVLSSPKSMSNRSFKPLTDETQNEYDSGSQAIVSSSEEEEDQPQEVQPEVSESTDTVAPQLVMPSLKMPSRRPFTETGKHIPRFKVLVAGRPGVGKTSLIRSIVQTCEHIIHVDSASPTTTKLGPASMRRSMSGGMSQDSSSTACINEIYASTKPYPSWWSDFEESRVLRRRKSMGDPVLERNLCFVDTPGRKNSIDDVILYMKEQLLRTLSAFNDVNSDLLSLLSGNGGHQVDAVLYLFSKDTMTDDFENIRQLSEFCNVIPLLAKTDLLSNEDIKSLKKQFNARVEEIGVQPFTFGQKFWDYPSQGAPLSPHAVSSAKSSDADNMDASLLMSPDYVQPLVCSELQILLDQIMDRDAISWLRYSSSKKALKWRAKNPQPIAFPVQESATSPSARSVSRFSTTSIASTLSSPSASQVLVPYPGSDSLASGFTMARVTDHTQREEKMAQIRLAKWATDLQQSLRNERERYEALARNERAVWLTEKLGECVVDGSLVPVSQLPGFSKTTRSRAKENYEGGMAMAMKNERSARSGMTGSQDPLGLLQWIDEQKRAGVLILKVLGSLSVAGGLAWWIAQAWSGGEGAETRAFPIFGWDRINGLISST